MNKLRNQYKRFIYIIFFITASVWFFILLKYPKSTDTFNYLQWFGITWNVIAASFVFVYEKWLWRFLNREFDLGGKWDFTEIQYVISEDNQQKFRYKACGSMRIKQDVRSIAIVEGQTFKIKISDTDIEEKEQISSWHSLSCDIDEEATRIYCALSHQSSPGRTGGAVLYAPVYP